MPNSPKVVRLEGNLTVDRAAGLRSEMINSAAGRSDVTLDFSNAGTIDLSFVQLIYAASREVSSAGGKLLFAGELSPEIGRTLVAGGFCHTAPTDAEELSTALFDLPPAPAKSREGRG